MAILCRGLQGTDFALQDGASVIHLLCRAEKYIGSVLTLVRLAPCKMYPTQRGLLLKFWNGKGMPNADTMQQALELCLSLVNDHGRIRKKYWNFRAQNVQTVLDQRIVVTK